MPSLIFVLKTGFGNNKLLGHILDLIILG